MRQGTIRIPRPRTLRLLAAIALPWLTAAAAPSAADAAPAGPAVPTAAAALPVPAAPAVRPCHAERDAAATSSTYRIEMEDSSIWHAPGGTIVFTIVGPSGQPAAAQPAATVKAIACLRPMARDAKWSSSMILEPVPIPQPAGTTGAKFAVTIPWRVDTFPDYGWRFYPPAELRVMAFAPSSDSPALDVVREIRISPIWFGAVSAVVFVFAAGCVLSSFAKYLGVPGRRVPLRLISTANGWASLAQFQIILWTLVIGAGAAYVMTLRGTLIDISGGTLMLLGIAGAAAVGSQLKTSQQGQAAPTLAPPGPLQGLAIGMPAASEVLLSWAVPTGGGAPSAYTVQFQPAGGPSWFTAGTSVTRPRFLLVGLAPSTTYNVQVFATNAAGSGTPMAIPVTTAAAVPPPAGAPPAVAGLGRLGNATADSIPLSWTAQRDVTYTVQFRAHDSDEDWRIFGAGLTAPATRVTGLRPSAVYDLRVFATNASGNGAPSPILSETTGLRMPKWSDIVTDTDRPAEIDVTRVQMLFFTVISAVFVALKIASSGAIPEIPASYVTLMGISNGVYLTAKFAAR